MMFCFARTPCLLVLGALSFSWPLHAARARGVPDLTREGLPNIQSASALVVDMTNDVVLYERDADTVRPIASISKLIGAIVVHEECKLDPKALHEMTVANRDAAKGGDRSKLTTGWKYSHEDLLHAALMRSDNRALPALGEACGMTPATFGNRMTARVRKMGLIRTEFMEPNGLSSANVSTARELQVVLKEVVKIPELTSIMSKKEYAITGFNKAGRAYPIRIRNTDRLLSKNLAQIVGGKTGYTDIARYCFAVAAKTLTGRNLGMVFLGAEGRHTRFADFTRVIRWLTPGEQLAKDEDKSPAKVAPQAASVVPAKEAVAPVEEDAPGTEGMSW